MSDGIASEIPMQVSAGVDSRPQISLHDILVAQVADKTTDFSHAVAEMTQAGEGKPVENAKGQIAGIVGEIDALGDKATPEKEFDFAGNKGNIGKGKSADNLNQVVIHLPLRTEQGLIDCAITVTPMFLDEPLSYKITFPGAEKPIERHISDTLSGKEASFLNTAVSLVRSALQITP